MSALGEKNNIPLRHMYVIMESFTSCCLRHTEYSKQDQMNLVL